jgi:hypothetical protein
LAAVIVAALLAAIAIIVPAKLTALRRSILGRRKIPPARTALLTAATIAPASAPPAPTSTAAAIASTAVMLALAVVSSVIAGTSRIVLSRVETWREILGSRSVGFGLPLFSRFRVTVPSR